MAQSTGYSDQRCPMMIDLNRLDKLLGQEEGRGPWQEEVGIPGEFDEREDFDSYVARVKLFWKVKKVAEEEKTDQFLL